MSLTSMVGELPISVGMIHYRSEIFLGTNFYTYGSPNLSIQVAHR